MEDRMRCEVLLLPQANPHDRPSCTVRSGLGSHATALHVAGQEFQFDRIYDQTDNPALVANDCLGDLVNDCAAGSNVCVFISGEADDKEVKQPFAHATAVAAASQLFGIIDEAKHAFPDDPTTWNVRVSMFTVGAEEAGGEVITDALAAAAGLGAGGVSVSGPFSPGGRLAESLSSAKPGSAGGIILSPRSGTSRHVFVPVAQGNEGASGIGQGQGQERDGSQDDAGFSGSASYVAMAASTGAGGRLSGSGVDYGRTGAHKADRVSRDRASVAASVAASGLQLRVDPTFGSATVPGLWEVECEGPRDVVDLLASVPLVNTLPGEKRCHSVVHVTLHCRRVEGSLHALTGDMVEDEVNSYSRLSVVRLARASGSGQGQRPPSSTPRTIPAWVLALSDVLTAVEQRAPGIPFAASRATMLLRDSLIGRQPSAFIALVPNQASVGLATLQFATRVRQAASTLATAVARASAAGTSPTKVFAPAESATSARPAPSPSPPRILVPGPMLAQGQSSGGSTGGRGGAMNQKSVEAAAAAAMQRYASRQKARSAEARSASAAAEAVQVSLEASVPLVGLLPTSSPGKNVQQQQLRKSVSFSESVRVDLYTPPDSYPYASQQSQLWDDNQGVDDVAEDDDEEDGLSGMGAVRQLDGSLRMEEEDLAASLPEQRQRSPLPPDIALYANVPMLTEPWMGQEGRSDAESMSGAGAMPSASITAPATPSQSRSQQSISSSFPSFPLASPTGRTGVDLAAVSADLASTSRALFASTLQALTTSRTEVATLKARVEELAAAQRASDHELAARRRADEETREDLAARVDEASTDMGRGPVHIPRPTATSLARAALAASRTRSGEASTHSAMGMGGAGSLSGTSSVQYSRPPDMGVPPDPTDPEVQSLRDSIGKLQAEKAALAKRARDFELYREVVEASIGRLQTDVQRVAGERDAAQKAGRASAAAASKGRQALGLAQRRIAELEALVTALEEQGQDKDAANRAVGQLRAALREARAVSASAEESYGTLREEAGEEVGLLRAALVEAQGAAAREHRRASELAAEVDWARAKLARQGGQEREDEGEGGGRDVRTEHWSEQDHKEDEGEEGDGRRAPKGVPGSTLSATGLPRAQPAPARAGGPRTRMSVSSAGAARSSSPLPSSQGILGRNQRLSMSTGRAPLPGQYENGVMMASPSPAALRVAQAPPLPPAPLPRSLMQRPTSASGPGRPSQDKRWGRDDNGDGDDELMLAARSLAMEVGAAVGSMNSSTHDRAHLQLQPAARALPPSTGTGRPPLAGPGGPGTGVGGNFKKAARGPTPMKRSSA